MCIDSQNDGHERQRSFAAFASFALTKKTTDRDDFRLYSWYTAPINLTSFADVTHSSACPFMMTFGDVPVRVAVPPTFAAYATAIVIPRHKS